MGAPRVRPLLFASGRFGVGRHLERTSTPGGLADADGISGKPTLSCKTRFARQTRGPRCFRYIGSA
jgi:hypothetical protein